MKLFQYVIYAALALGMGVWLYNWQPWLSPCEKLDRRCAKANASLNFWESATCSMANLVMYGKRTDEVCQKVLDRLDQKEHSAPSEADEPSTHCGDPAHKPGAVELVTEWPKYACMDEDSAGDSWGSCLKRTQYTYISGKGCPGSWRCCPWVDTPGERTTGEKEDQLMILKEELRRLKASDG